MSQDFSKLTSLGKKILVNRALKDFNEFDEVSKKHPDLALACVKECPEFIRYVENPTEELIMTALNQDIETFFIIKNPKQEYKNIFLKKNPYQLFYIKNKSREDLSIFLTISTMKKMITHFLTQY